MQKLVLIDGNSIAYRAFFALPLLSNASGLYTNSVYGFTMMLMKVIEEEKPTHVLVAFDEGKTTFRHREYGEYKGTRQKTPGELSEQIPLIHEVLDAFGIRHFGMDGYEADDIIGTLAHSPETEGMEVRIVSGDKDLLQLVNDRVRVMLTRKGVTELETYDVRAVKERYGLEPRQIIDLKGLMGDPSDNIPGIPGVGEKTALKLLHQFPTVEDVVANADAVSGKKLQEKIREFKEQALFSKKLATIFTEVPLPFKVEDLKLPPLDVQRVAEVFRKLEFKTLIDRIEKDRKTQEPLQTNEPLPELKVTMIRGEEERIALEGLFERKRLALVVEADGENYHRSAVVGLALSDGERHAFLTLEEAENWPAFRRWLEDPSRNKVAFDVKRAKLLLEKEGLNSEGWSFDALLAAYLLNPSESRTELSDVVAKHLGERIPSDEDVYGKGAKKSIPQGEPLAAHLARKAEALHRLEPVLARELKEAGMDALMFDLEFPLAFTLARMEQRGVAVDRDGLDELGVELKENLDRLEREIYELAGTEFNINSPKQLGEILFDKLGLPVLKKTKTGYSTSADVLEKLAPQHEIVEKILHFRQVGKLHSTYVEGLRKEIAGDGKIHTSFNQTVTATGRLSSTEPNLQNIPIRLEEGRRIRKVFVPSEPGWLILAADYSQIELRVLAHISEDENLRRAFRENRDIHTATAMEVFGVSEDEVTPLMRRQAKAVNFGIVYGISGYGLAQNLDIPQKEAKEFIERYFETYPGVKRYMEEVVQKAKQDGYVTTLLGRRRWLPMIHSRNYGERSFAERTAMNTPIQGTAADIIKHAMLRVEREMQARNLKSRMLLQVHDELIFEVPEEELEEMKQLVRDLMEDALPLSVPLRVDVSSGRNWYEAK
ncbi:DNA polymerase I [Staphylospora marina]|uniref:DNA polymerase I n=1 Tax=Staphylospora marina TaxID=2490858 RepID=UPI000F5B9751|nr:DNA polymerase I [Staphylospora marina]